MLKIGKYKTIAQWNSRCAHCGKTINKGDDAFLIGSIWLKPARVKRICYECGSTNAYKEKIK